MRPGTYFLSSFVRTPDPAYLTPGTLGSIAYFGRPELKITGDTTVDFDATKAHLLSVKTDRPSEAEGDASSRSPAPGTTRGSTPAPSAAGPTTTAVLCRRAGQPPRRAPGSSVTGRVATRPPWSPCRSSAAPCCTRSRRRTRSPGLDGVGTARPRRRRHRLVLRPRPRGWQGRARQGQHQRHLPGDGQPGPRGRRQGAARVRPGSRQVDARDRLHAAQRGHLLPSDGRGRPAPGAPRCRPRWSS